MTGSILITGAGGFLGMNLCEAALARGLAVVALNDSPFPAPAGVVVETADVRDREALAAVLARHRPGAVIHAAAVTLAPGSALVGVETAFDVNTVSTAILLEESCKAGVSRFVYPSSTAVYGAALYDGAPMTEDVAPRPASVYGYTKLASERLVAETASAFGLQCVRARITALFGPHERETGVRDLLSLPWQIAQAAREGRAVRLPEGHARDWTLARDATDALVTLAMAEAPEHDLYNIGLGQVWDPALLARVLSERYPSWDCGAGAADGSDSGFFFPDDPSAPREPLVPDRFTAEFGPAFHTPQDACRIYADWLTET